MALSKRDREFRLAKISYLEFKQVELDRVLTALFARLAHGGFPSRLSRPFELEVETFVGYFLEHPEWFTGFSRQPDIVARWVATHLMDLVNRGRPAEALAGPRPLHGFTYRFRNPKHSRDYGASQQLYEMLYHARRGAGQGAIEQLRAFFFPGIDAVTGRIDHAAALDVETQALLRLPHQDVRDESDQRKGAREVYPPLCVGGADLLADDVKRVLFYQRFVPRSVMVDYLKVLLAFHLALYHLRLLKLLPVLVRRKGADPTCAACPMNPQDAAAPQGDCPHRVGVLLDAVGRPGTDISRLAERSVDMHYRRIPPFVKAYFTTRKLDEFAWDLVRRGRVPRPEGGTFTVAEIHQLLEPVFREEREKFFGQRIYGLIQDSSGAPDVDLDPELKAVTEMGLDDLQTYIEMLIAMRGPFHRRYITECLDSLLLKNRPGAVIAQPRVKGAPRRFVLDSRLLEVLLQISVLQPGGALGYHTSELRIDTLLASLRRRYGLYIDRLPRGDGFGPASILDRAALRENLVAFTARLRDIGFYRDLSDAHVTQTVTPRYRIGQDDQLAGNRRGGSKT